MYLLDSSAWLIHLFGETGVEQVNRLFDNATNVYVSVLSLPEVYGRLRAIEQQHNIGLKSGSSTHPFLLV
jgi:PIN domain nuclease of toxin-antitoxin system